MSAMTQVLSALAGAWEADARLADQSSRRADGSISGRAYRLCAGQLRAALAALEAGPGGDGFPEGAASLGTGLAGDSA